MYPSTTMLLWPLLGVAAFYGAVARQHQFLAPDSAVGEGAAVAVPTRSTQPACATSTEEGQTYSPSGTVQELAALALPQVESDGNSSYKPRAYADFIPCPGLAALYNAGLLNPTLEGGHDLKGAAAEAALMATVPKNDLFQALRKYGLSKRFADLNVGMLINNGREPFPLFRMTQFPELRHWKGTFARYSATADGCRPTEVGFDNKKFNTMLASHDNDKDGSLSLGELGSALSQLGASSPDGPGMAHYVVFAVAANTMGGGGAGVNIDTLRLLYKGFFQSSISMDGVSPDSPIMKKTGYRQVFCEVFKIKMAGLFR